MDGPLTAQGPAAQPCGEPRPVQREGRPPALLHHEALCKPGAYLLQTPTRPACPRSGRSAHPRRAAGGQAGTRGWGPLPPAARGPRGPSSPGARAASLTLSLPQGSKVQGRSGRGPSNCTTSGSHEAELPSWHRPRRDTVWAVAAATAGPPSGRGRPWQPPRQSASRRTTRIPPAVQTGCPAAPLGEGAAGKAWQVPRAARKLMVGTGPPCLL